MTECGVCSRKFAAPKHLKQHILGSVQNSPEHLTLCCQRCNSKVFASVAAKQNHLLGSPKHRICAFCPEHWDFETKKELKAHFQTEHPGQSPGNTQLIANELIRVTDVQYTGAIQAPAAVVLLRAQQRARVPVGPASASPLDRFFASHPSFPYNASLPPATSYHALLKHFGWNRRSDEAMEAKDGYQDALKEEVGIWFGREDDLEAWHTLCRAVGVRSPPSTIERCRHVLRNTHVNIVDLIEWGRDGGLRSVKVFQTQKELKDYSFENGKIFPSSEVQVNGETNVVLRHLLRKFGVRQF